MMSRQLWRVLALAFCIFGNMGVAVNAHALPGSRLVFSQQSDQLNLTIALPVEDLIFALPAAGSLEFAPMGIALEKPVLSDLSKYFSDHLQVLRGSDEMNFTLENATIEHAHNDHVGTFRMLVMQFRAINPINQELFPLALTYDAVMHEVRNHRATIFSKSRSGNLLPLADFGYRPIEGQQKSILLQAP